MKGFIERLLDFRGTGWVGHDPDMPLGGYNESLLGNAPGH